jgi:hypothetical protein
MGMHGVWATEAIDRGGRSANSGATNASRRTPHFRDLPQGCDARRDFLDMIGISNMTTDLMLGSVRGDFGIAMPSWVSVRARYRLIVRGSEHVAYRRCEVCGEHIYSASGTEYLFSAPPADASIYESDVMGFIVSPSLIDTSALRRQWPKLGIEKLKVLTHPLTHLGSW